MKARNYFLAISFALVTTILATACKTPLSPCESKKSASFISGDNLRFSSDDGSIWFDVSNDDNYVNVSIVLHENGLYRKLIRNGLKIYLSPNNQQNISRYLEYRLDVLNQFGEQSEKPPLPPSDNPDLSFEKHEISAKDKNPPPIKHDLQKARLIWHDGAKTEIVSLDSISQKDIIFKVVNSSPRNMSLNIGIKKSILNINPKKGMGLGIEFSDRKNPKHEKPHDDKRPDEGPNNFGGMPTNMSGRNGMRSGGMSGMQRGARRHHSFEEEDKEKDRVWVNVLF